MYLFNKEAEMQSLSWEFLSFACTKMNASFRLKISIHPRLLSFHEYRDPSISKVSVKRHSPTTTWQHGSCCHDRNVLSAPWTQRKAPDVTAYVHARILFSLGSTSVTIFGNKIDLLFCLLWKQQSSVSPMKVFPEDLAEREREERALGMLRELFCIFQDFIWVSNIHLKQWHTFIYNELPDFHKMASALLQSCNIFDENIVRCC